MTTETIRIQGEGPIKEAVELRFPAGGGIVVAKGSNGTGKTHAQHAVQRLLGGKQRLVPSDGVAKGIVEGGGVRLTIGGSVRSSGECRFAGLEGKFDLGTFVDPGVADGEAADSRRIKALLSMTGVKGSPATFAGIHPDLAVLVDNVALTETDVVEQARKIKASLEQRARTLESDRDKERNRAEAAWGAAGDVKPEDAQEFDQAAAGAELESAVAEKSRLAEQRRQYTEAQERARRAKAALAGIEAGPDVESCEKRLANAKDAFQKAQAEQAAAATALETAKRERATTQTAYDAIAAAGRATDVDDTDLQAADAHVADVRERVQRGQVILEARRHFATARQHEAEAHKLEAQAEAIRGAAKQTDDVLSGLVSSGRIRIEAGRMVTDHATRGKPVLLSDLSSGELMQLAILEAVDAFRKTGAEGMPLLIVDQDLWQHLDPWARAQVYRACTEHHVCILAAEVAAGGLRFEPYQPTGDEVAPPEPESAGEWE
ncbi:MAG: hypothetical protein ABII76_26015 [Pseudomonadota bacterium]